MKTRLAVVLLTSGLVSCTGRTSGPGPTVPVVEPSGSSHVSAPLLRRIAEAADGFRDGNDYFVVIDQRPPYRVLAVLPAQSAADSAAAANRSDTTDYAVFGPYRTVQDAGAVERAEDEVLEVVVKTRGGKEKHYDGTKYDALFWSIAAFDKFIAPYLTSVSGVRYAAEQRQLYLEGRSPLAHSKDIGHYRSSF